MFLIPSSWSWVLRLLYTPAKGSKEIVCPGGFSQNHGVWLALRPSEKCWCRGAETHCHLKSRDGEGAGASSYAESSGSRGDPAHAFHLKRRYWAVRCLPPAAV